jgi:hypothetical protein
MTFLALRTSAGLGVTPHSSGRTSNQRNSAPAGELRNWYGTPWESKDLRLWFRPLHNPPLSSCRNLVRMSANHPKPTYRRIVLRCCSVSQAKPSPDYEYRISLRPHPVGHPSSSTRDSASRAVPSSSQARRVSGSWRMAAGRRRSARSRGSEGLCPSRIPKTAQRSASGVLDHR